jgi:hypothetical protein
MSIRNRVLILRHLLRDNSRSRMLKQKEILFFWLLASPSRNAKTMLEFNEEQFDNLQPFLRISMLLRHQSPSIFEQIPQNIILQSTDLLVRYVGISRVGGEPQGSIDEIKSVRKNTSLLVFRASPNICFFVSCFELYKAIADVFEKFGFYMAPGSKLTSVEFMGGHGVGEYCLKGGWRWGCPV